jgi:hypothetical protein
MESPPPKMQFFNFHFALQFLSYSSTKTSKTLTIDDCVKDLSDLFNEIGESCSPPLPRAAGENARTKAYKSKTKTISAIFLDIPNGEAFKYLRKKINVVSSF